MLLSLSTLDVWSSLHVHSMAVGPSLDWKVSYDFGTRKLAKPSRKLNHNKWRALMFVYVCVCVCVYVRACVFVCVCVRACDYYISTQQARVIGF